MLEVTSDDTPGGQREQDAGSGLDAGLIPVTVPELLRLSRGIVIPPPRQDRPLRLHWSDWRRRHLYRARQAHQRWSAYASGGNLAEPGPAPDVGEDSGGVGYQ
jgi:hypothetical protein